MWLAFRSYRGALDLPAAHRHPGLAWGYWPWCCGLAKVHIFTLVIRLPAWWASPDYGIHFLTERPAASGRPAPDPPPAAQPLSVALFATLVGYGLLWLALPRHGRWRSAPWWKTDGLVHYRALPVPRSGSVTCPAGRRVLVPMALWLSWWRRWPPCAGACPLLCLILIGAGLGRLEVDDDIARLPPAHRLQAQERQIQQLTGQQGGMTGFLVTGKDGETACSASRAMSQKLTEARAAGQLAGFVSLASGCPSLAQQRADPPPSPVCCPRWWRGSTGPGCAGGRAPSPWHLTPAHWLGSPVSEGSRLLWHGLPDGRVALWRRSTG